MQMTEEQLQEVIAKSLSEGMTKHLGEVVNAKLEEKMKELNIDKIDRKYGMIPMLNMEDEKAALRLTKKQRIADFVKAVFFQDAAKLMEMGCAKAMTNQTGSAAGFTVPEEFLAEVARIAEDFGYIRKFARKITMKRDVLDAAALGTSVTTYWPGEANAGTESNPIFTQPELEAKTLVGISTASNELLADTGIDLVDFLMTIFGEAMAGEEDNQGFTGTGAPFTGALTDANVTIVNMASTNTAFSNVTLDNLIDLQANVKSSVLPSSAYFMHRTVWAYVKKLTESSQHILSFANPQVLANQGPGLLAPAGYIQGYPVYLSDKMPASSASAVSTKFILFGSLPMGMMFGDRQSVEMQIAKEAVVNSVSMFERNLSAIRLTERIGIVIAQPTALVVLKTAAS